MKYLIITNSIEASDYASILTKEIRRFDIRAEIFGNQGAGVVECNDDRSFEVKYVPIKSKLFKTNTYDLIIAIGDTFDEKLKTWGRMSMAKTCFFQITTNFEKGITSFKSALTHFDKVFPDLPIYGKHSKSECFGHYLNDVIRKHDFAEEQSEELRIAVLTSSYRGINKVTKLIRKLSEDYKECRWLISDATLNVKTRTKFEIGNNIHFAKNKLDQLRNANVAIVDSEVDSIVVALLNCPQLSISGNSGLFGFSKIKKPLVNEVLGESIVKNFSPNQHHQIKEELDQILSNHEYCASMMALYQEFKEKLGTQPVARMAAQNIIEWLEETEN